VATIALEMRASGLLERATGASEAWETTLQRIYWVRTELTELLESSDPDRGEDGLVPNSPADESAIERAERRIGHKLPPSYRAFLTRFDGWNRFFDGATLLGTKDLGKSSYADLAQAAFEAAETPIPDGGPPSSRVRGYPGDLITFGIDPEGTTLFAFDPSSADERGEMQVVAWIHEFGIRRESFADFLDGVLELCEADRLNAKATRPPAAEDVSPIPESGLRVGARETTLLAASP
jgi:hypothetical protein